MTRDSTRRQTAACNERLAARRRLHSLDSKKKANKQIKSNLDKKKVRNDRKREALVLDSSRDDENASTELLNIIGKSQKSLENSQLIVREHSLEEELDSVELVNVTDRIEIEVDEVTDELTWDSQADLESPLKDTTDILDFTCAFKEQVSTSLTRSLDSLTVEGSGSLLSSLALEISDPVITSLRLTRPRKLNRVRFSSEESDLQVISQNTLESAEESFVRRNFEAKETGIRMDDQRYENIIKKLKEGARKVKHRISRYTKDDVTIMDKDVFHDELKDIRVIYDVYIEQIDEAWSELQENETDRLTQVELFKTDITNTLKDNERGVKEKMAELIAIQEANRPEILKEKTVKVDKLKKRIEFIKAKAKDVTNKLKDVTDVENFTDNQIREYISESKD